MQELEWKTSCGCAKCRPALNYYMLCNWPGEYVDDSQSRFINERVHANIQKDGTYSVVPRMWGGQTSAKELRAIADIVDKYKIPTVKVTGGQRIDMLGVAKEDLPGVWADLSAAGMVSGHAYAKGLRTVKTCVGTDWCRFGTQDSTGLGVKLEKFMWGSWTPAKVKLAVSGCPRNCAEATCKDIGVICIDSGYDIHFAGAAGLEIKGTELLGHVATEEETIEAIGALDAALPRAGPLSRAHLQVGQARRAGDHPPADHGGRRAPPHPLRPLRVLPAVRPERPVGRARQRQGRARVHAGRRPHPARGRGMSALDSPWIEVCPIDSIPLRGCRVVRTRHMQIALFRTASDEVFALENRCPHKNGPLSEGIVHDRKVTCPLHNWVISLESGEATGADKGCTRSFPVRLDKGRVYLEASVATAP